MTRGINKIDESCDEYFSQAARKQFSFCFFYFKHNHLYECGLFMLMWFEMGYFSFTDLLLVQTSAQKRKHIAALYPLRLLCNPID